MIRFLPFSTLGALTDLIPPVKEHIVDGSSPGRVSHLPYPPRRRIQSAGCTANYGRVGGGGRGARLLWDGCVVWGPGCLALTECIHPRENVKQI